MFKLSFKALNILLASIKPFLEVDFIYTMGFYLKNSLTIVAHAIIFFRVGNQLEDKNRGKITSIDKLYTSEG